MEPSLFGDNPIPDGISEDAPLAARMRPRTFDDVVGQSHLTAPEAAFRRAVEADQLRSIILWGPPGVGKTTLAEVIAGLTKSKFFRVSAVSAGVADLRRVIEEARTRRKMNGQRSILFIDEIHRFNKAQQDAILPVVEDGTITLIGATTENPSFEVISALLSRSRVFVLKPLSDEEIANVIKRALGREFPEEIVEPDAFTAIVNLANGDARSALNMLEASIAAKQGGAVSLKDVESAIQRRTMLYDKGGEMHFDIISALHKSVRGSDPDASLYWLARMLEGGEDPMYLARRLVRMAVEDVGLADPHALPLAMAAQQAMHLMGMPEGALALGEVAVYMATAPKSNRLYEAYGSAQRDVLETRNDPVPMHLRNAPTKLMKEEGYGEGYKYAHQFDEAVVEQRNLPESLGDRKYYRPSDRGYEADVSARMEAWREILARRSSQNHGVK
jgi:putative ATPase